MQAKEAHIPADGQEGHQGHKNKDDGGHHRGLMPQETAQHEAPLRIGGAGRGELSVVDLNNVFRVERRDGCFRTILTHRILLGLGDDSWG